MRIGSLIPALIVAGLLALALAWHDVLPGGWTLRGWVKPHSERAALARATHAAARLAQFETLIAEAPSDAVAFLGSSTIERFPIQELFPGQACLNLGIASESASELLSRLGDGLPPRLGAAVLYIGSIDFREHIRPAQQIAALAEQVLVALRLTHPGLPVAVLGILPEQDMDSEFIARLRRTNTAIAAVCRRQECAFVSTQRAPITDENGSLQPEYASDRVHLNALGYAQLARWLITDGGVAGRILQSP